MGDILVTQKLPGDPAAKLCGKPLNIDVEKENILLTRGGGGGG